MTKVAGGASSWFIARVAVVRALQLVGGAAMGAMPHQLLLAQATVSASGQASVSIPIAVPPGIAGMAPNLSLQFGDGGISGHLGVGWSLQGTSMITRCPATRPVDGKAAPVEFKPTDKLCLDGQRLIPINSAGDPVNLSSGDANGIGTSETPSPTAFQEFRTEKDSFARIRAYGAAGGVAANGPSVFKVWTKSGQIYEYGTNFDGNANARIYPFNTSAVPPVSRTQVAVWAVSRISDVKGNYINFKYLSVLPQWGSGTSAGVFIGQEWGLIEVQYSGTENPGATPPISQVPSNKLIIEYEPRYSPSASGFDQAETYQFGNKNLLTYRIKAIRTFVNSPNPATLGKAANAVIARTMLFGYEQSGTSGRSRLTNIKECADESGTVCFPSRKFSYLNGTTPASITFTANSTFNSTLGTKQLTDAAGTYGVLTGDFNADGLTDILRYSYTATQNEMWLSQGNGSFSLASSYNLGTTPLFSSDGCYSAMVADFNGDGLSDILRMRKASCGVGNVLLLNQGNGTFSSVSLLASMDLEQKKANESTQSAACSQPSLKPAPVEAMPNRGRVIPGTDQLNPAAPPRPLDAGLQLGGVDTPLAGSCWLYSRTIGKRFFVLDLDGDGILDILTTVAVPYTWNSGWGRVPSESELCWGSGNPSWADYCSRVYKGSSTGAFTDFTDLATTANNIRNSSLYAHPPSLYGGTGPSNNAYWKRPDLADLDGDGLLDVLASITGRWRSDGNFGFISSPAQGSNYVCPTSIDFNGDGRADCLWPASTGAGQSLNISFGADASANITQFNLTGAADNLYAVNAQQQQTAGIIIEDFDGDGRQDILRWGPSPIENGIYFSNGDGSFRTRVTAGLNSISRPLNAADGTSSVVLGDFLGTGALQLLHMKHNPTAGGDPATSNQLYSRNYSPIDVLATATSPTGLVTTIGTRVPLTNAGGRYINERGTADAAVLPVVDLRLPMYVVPSLTQDTGTSGTTSITTQYLYKGLKAERGGRGLLGFREVRQQNPAPGSKSITVATRYLLGFPYDGVASRSTTYANSSTSLALEPLTGQMISRTSNIYCDTTASAGAVNSASEAAPCPTTAKITKPYLRSSVEEGWELGSATELPKVTTVNTYNLWGDPTTILVTTEGKFDNAAPYTTNRQYIKTTTNTFCAPSTDSTGALQCTVGGNSVASPNDIRGEKWILGRLSRSTVRNQVPNLTGVLTTSPGSGSTALQGP